ncbi:MAG: energy-coupling factor ABC transporter ATP-binding protein [Treponema sp.]|jgi:biotin transport system ATP-binding protein|nr:energy-coupling factor ABC transporter ATP-binding protein [Treponema sp.]
MIEFAVRLWHITKTFHVLDEMAGDRKQSRIRDGVFYALDDVSFDIEQSVCTLIAGANGSGKSLLMSIIAGLEQSDSGKLEVRGKTGLVFQDPDSQILGETPKEDITIGIRGKFFSKKKDSIPIVENALRETGILSRADFPSRFLSGGEKRRLAVAGVLAMNAEIIIFDEPYANLDYPGVVQVNVLIQKLLAKKRTIVILTHELEKCLALAKNGIVLYEGKTAFNGTSEECLTLPLEQWGIHNPLHTASRLEDLIWI